MLIFQKHSCLLSPSIQTEVVLWSSALNSVTDTVKMRILKENKVML
jgi:hypothetical protein